MKVPKRTTAASAVVAVLALVGIVAVMLAPDNHTPRTPEWGEHAAAWVDARNAAARAGIANLLEFVDPDVVHDLCVQSPPANTVGRDAYAAYLQEEFGDSLSYKPIEDVHVDRDGAVFKMWSGGDLAVELSVSGRTTLERYPALASGYIDSPEYQRVRAVARAYLDAWASGDHAALDVLYAEDAVVTDSLAATSLHGRDAVVQYSDGLRSGGRSYTVRQGDPRWGDWDDQTWTVASVCWEEGGAFAGQVVYLPVTGDDGTGCPGYMTVALQVAGGVVEAERRYHHVGSVRACWDTDQLPAGWWTDLEIPRPHADSQTGLVEAGGQRIPIHNGTDALGRLVTWAFERFDAAGLAPPAVAAVTFDEGVRARECTEDHSGLTVNLGDAARVYVCLDQEAACADSKAPGACDAFTNRARRLTLHEFAHGWMDQKLDDATRRAFVDHMALPTWSGAAVDWNQRGVERAAQVIAWGLMDEPIGTALIEEGPCAHLVDGFTILTGAAPLQRRCT